MKFQCFVDINNQDNSSKTRKIAREISVLENFIAYHYLKTIKTKALGLRIYLISDKLKERINNPIAGIYPLVNIYMYFDFDNYLKSTNNYEKKEIIIKMFKEGIYRCAESMVWDIDPFIDAFQKIDALDFTFVSHTKKKRYKGIKKYIQLETVCEPGFYHYYLLVKEGEKLHSRHKVVTINAFYNLFFEHNRIITEDRWEDSNTFVILGKKGHLERIKYEYKIDTDTLTTIFNLEPDVNEKEFMEEFDLATTQDPKKIELVLNNNDTLKWHIYI